MKKAYGLALLLFVALLPMGKVCFGAPTIEPVETIMINVIDKQGKVYSVLVKDGVATLTPIFTDISAKMLVVNEKGKAFIAAQSLGGTMYYMADVFSSTRTSVQLSSDALIIPPSADLSLEGDKICFTTGNEQKSEVWVVDTASGKCQLVFQNDGPVSPASWSSDGKTITYYFGSVDATTNDAYQVGCAVNTAEGWQHTIIAPPSRLSQRSPSRRHPPMWAGHGSIIVFDARYKDDERGPQTYAIHVTTRDLWRIAGYNATPTRHPNGHDVVFVDRTANEVRVWQAASTKAEKLIRREGVYYPKLSPGGKYIAYSDRDGKIYITSIDGKTTSVVFDTQGMLPCDSFQWIVP